MNAKVYNSLKEYFETEKFTEGQGDIVSTLGFDSENDGGAADYLVESTVLTDSNEITFIGDSVTCRGIKLRLLPENGVAYVEQFGAKGDYDLSKVSDADRIAFFERNSQSIQLALNSGFEKVAFLNKVYMVSGDILINSPVKVIGNSAKLKLTNDNSSVFTVGCQDTVLENVELSDLTLEGSSANGNCALVEAGNVGNFTMNRILFDNGKSALCVNESSHNISVRNCTAVNVIHGFELDNVIDFRVNNCKIELAADEDSKGLYLTQGTCFGVVEDLSVCNGGYAVYYDGNGEPWDGIAIERILFKNLLVDECNYGVMILYNQIPLHFSNAMLVNVNYGVHMECARNLVVTNSSVLIKSPSTAAGDAVPICVRTYAQAKFSHTQFDFPHNFNDMFTYDEGEPCELSFVDCTIQKTDIAGVDGVVEPAGFGYITDTHSLATKFTETFDACEFRSYIQNYSSNNMPIALFAPIDSGSKLIIKNCRFVNDSTCTVPYFKLDDTGKFDNIVVYNCFFENYDCSYDVTAENGTEDVYPIFGRVVKGNIVTSNTYSNGNKIHNIFAKCNMRSSAPNGTNGTTINEVLEYI